MFNMRAISDTRLTEAETTETAKLLRPVEQNEETTEKNAEIETTIMIESVENMIGLREALLIDMRMMFHHPGLNNLGQRSSLFGCYHE